MSTIQVAFDERLEEVQAYLDFLASMEAQMQNGPPKFMGAEDVISPQQQKMLYATVYLQLYNLVEATMTMCLDAVAGAFIGNSRWTAAELSNEILREWVRSTARTHADLEYQRRLEEAVRVVAQVIEAVPVSSFKIEQGGGGNWDDLSIEKMSERVGCALNVSAPVRASVKRHIKDDLGSMALVKTMRNRLAHGNISFTESADQVTVSQLTTLAQSVIAYLKEVVDRFTTYVNGLEFLLPEHRPVTAP